MHSYPFTSQVTYDDEGLPLYDRAVDSAFLRKVFAQYFSDGIFYKPASALQVVADTGMQVVVEPGCCHIQGAIGIEDARRTLVVQAAEDLDRIDTVVARLDLSLAARDIDLYIVKGTAAASPQPPTLTRDATVWELGLANLFVAKNVSTISQQRITDTRLDATRCGVVAQTIGALDTSPYFAQIQAALAEIQQQADAQLDQMEFTFDSWLETIKGKLGTDPATALQAQVDDLQAAAGGMPLELSAGSNSVQMVADENRLGNVTVEGFTTQTGSGTPSYTNIRKINNAGEFNALVTITGAESGWYQYTDPSNGVVTYVCPSIAPGWTSANALNGLCSGYKVQNVISVTQALRGPTAANSAGTIIIRDDSVSTLQAFKVKMSQIKPVVAYLSTENTGKFYTGIQIAQNENYEYTIIELQDRLHNGDNLQTNVAYNNAQKFVENHIKRTYVFTGKESCTKYTDNSGLVTYIYSGIAPGWTEENAVNAICSAYKVGYLSDAQIVLRGPTSANPAGTIIIRNDTIASTEELNAQHAALLKAGTPVVIEYELAQPEVFADEPVEIKNPRGAFTVSGESGTMCKASLKPLILPPVLSVNKKTGNVVLSAEDVGALPASGGAYSTTEPINTGKMWIDGAPIYMQAYTFNSQKLPQLQYTTFIPISSFEGLSHFVDIKGHVYLNGVTYPIILPCAIGDSVIDVQATSRGVELFRTKLSDKTYEGSTPYPTEATNNITLVVEYSKLGG